MPRCSVTERFWGKVDKTGGCWLWTSVRRPDGYGLFWFEGRYQRAHRIAYLMTFGEPGDTLDHLCRVRHCVNPDHLESVSRGENVRRGGNAAKTHCPQGHSYDDKNTSYYRGSRRCKACALQRYYDRKEDARV